MRESTAIKLLTFFIPSRKLRHRIRAWLMKDYRNFLWEYHLIRQDIRAVRLHPDTFGQYKNAFAGKDVVLIATGPTLRDFIPIEEAVYVGVNRAFLYDKIKMDFLFMQDYTGLDYIEEAANYPAQKFYGITNLTLGEKTLIPESIAVRHNAKRYYLNAVTDPMNEGKDIDFTYDITVNPLTCYDSVAFSAMQFILYGNPKRIYLVGCDANTKGYYNATKENYLYLDVVIRGWNKMRDFARAFYSETQIISINPVGLAGLFEDEYTNESLFPTNFDRWLDNNRIERMDANRKDIFDPIRCEFHLARYRKAAGYVQGKTVLDIASGTGYGADYLHKNGGANKVFGVEIDKNSVCYANTLYGNEHVTFRQGSILDIPFPDNSFDVITSFETLEHVKDEERQMSEIKRVLKGGGLYILSTPNDWDNTNNPFHVRNYDYHSLKALIAKHFELVEMFNQVPDDKKLPQKRGGGGGIVPKEGIEITTLQNYTAAECFIAIAKNK